MIRIIAENVSNVIFIYRSQLNLISQKNPRLLV